MNTRPSTFKDASLTMLAMAFLTLLATQPGKNLSLVPPHKTRPVHAVSHLQDRPVAARHETEKATVSQWVVL